MAGSSALISKLTEFMPLDDALTPFVKGIENFLGQIGVIVMGIGFILVVILLLWVLSTLSGRR